VECEWDPAKARANAAKHRVHFGDAVAALEDERAVTIRDHFSDEEERWITLGQDAMGVSWGLFVARGECAADFRAAGNAARAQEVHGESMKREYDFSKGKRGPVVAVPKTKERITIRLDGDILDWFRSEVERAGGGNYQTLINDALRQHIQRADESFEKTLRRVIREEIRRAS
jgi:uncharacterized protein (DUF4415 family)